MLFILLQALFALSIVILRKMSVCESPFLLVGLRLTLAGSILLLMQWIVDRTKLSLWYVHWRLLFVAAILNAYINNAFGLWGIQRLPSAVVSLITSTTPFITALLSYFLLQERLTKVQWVCLGIGMLGFIPVIISTNAVTQCPSDNVSVVLAMFSVMVAAVGSSYGWIIMRELIYEHHLSIMVTNGLTLLCGGILSCLHGYLVGEGWPSFKENDLFLSIMLTAFLTHIVGYSIYLLLLGDNSPTFIAFTSFAATSFTALIAWLWIGEPITMPLIISALIIFPSLLLFYRQERFQQLHS